ncbi:hypothetical protein Pint_34718 [Pistacia integerrima]|uniref:Uncharacterized protein n=2 Tax=Pistacia integerrima TaxID=434235 RepID=A0ACC0X836_9ROSI|nr:hypothetical protein Pint_34731 [Pistacia integerrima]KAJ0011016.1 hypothetical protein Pint_34718 [Pistacia integerrima]
MAKTVKSIQFFALFFILFLIGNWEMTMAEVQENLCEKASQTWSGYCGNTGKCNIQCKRWEDARSGACHQRGVTMKCFCYFNCPLDEHN